MTTFYTALAYYHPTDGRGCARGAGVRESIERLWLPGVIDSPGSRSGGGNATTWGPSGLPIRWVPLGGQGLRRSFFRPSPGVRHPRRRR